LLANPQHQAVPSLRTAHACPRPTAACVHPARAPTRTGLSWLVVDPSPSWPCLPAPQHHSVCPVWTAHVSWYPAETWAHWTAAAFAAAPATPGPAPKTTLTAAATAGGAPTPRIPP